MSFIDLGETFGRHATIGKSNDGSFYVSLTDWDARRGGGKYFNNIDDAIAYAKLFISGIEYKFGYNGIEL